MRLKSLLLCILSISIIFIHEAHGAGFSVNTQGATAVGQGNSVIAHTDDPSSVFYNPALINMLDGTQFEMGTAIIMPKAKFHSDATGMDYKIKDDVLFPSYLYFTHKFNDKFSVGLGVFNNFGLANDWGDTWEGRYIATKSELKTYTINPVVSYRVIPTVTVAAGFDILFANTKLNKMLNLSVLGLPDGSQRLKGDGTGIGYNLGLLVDITKDISFGASYRSKIKVDLDGNVNNGLPSMAPPPISSLFPNTSAQTTLKLPANAMFGIAYKGFKPLTLEVGARWEGWSYFDELRIKLDQPIAGTNEMIIPKDWKDSYSVNVGARYQVTNALALLAGYIYEKGPIPDSTFDPIVTDNGANIFMLGADLRYKNFLFSIAYDYHRMRSRNKNNTIDDNPIDGIFNPNTSANGRYKTYFHIVGISATYRF